MKVIKKGRKQKGWSVQTVCTGAGNGNAGCGAVLLVEQNDLYLTESQARDETTQYVTFRCCLCDVQTDLHGADKPPHDVSCGLPKWKPRNRRQTESDTE